MDLLDLTTRAHWSVSSWKAAYEIGNMFNGNASEYWESDGSAPHWITAQFRSETSVRRVLVQLDANADETYTPCEFSFQAGADEASLSEVGRGKPSKGNGWAGFEVSVSAIYFRISILRMLRDGRNCRVHGIRLLGEPIAWGIDPDLRFITPEFRRYVTVR
jgi:anaphase-promoting complex subunit 10